jgi:hypothetical protein
MQCGLRAHVRAADDGASHRIASHRIASHRIALPEPVIFRAFVPCAERGRAETQETV